MSELKKDYVGDGNRICFKNRQGDILTMHKTFIQMFTGDEYEEEQEEEDKNESEYKFIAESEEFSPE